MSDPATLGFVGLGVMGGRMCRNLAAKSGKSVIGYDVAPARIGYGRLYSPVIYRLFKP